MEEVEDSVVLSPDPDAQLVDSRLYEIGQGPSQLVAIRSQLLNRSHALGIGSRITVPQVTQPSQDRCVTAWLL